MQLPNGRLGLSLRLGLVGSDEMEAGFGLVDGAGAGVVGQSGADWSEAPLKGAIERTTSLTSCRLP